MRFAVVLFQLPLHIPLDSLPAYLILASFLQTLVNRSTDQVHFEDIVRASSDGEGTPFLDTYSLRNLVMAAPHSVQLLSAMHISPEKYLQRCAIVAPSGEECVLTFSAALQEVQECQ
jgi:hypothetical protein